MLFQVNSDGVISFGQRFTDYTPRVLPIRSPPFIAVYWADVETRRNNGHVYYRQVTGTVNKYNSSNYIVVVVIEVVVVVIVVVVIVVVVGLTTSVVVFDMCADNRCNFRATVVARSISQQSSFEL